MSERGLPTPPASAVSPSMSTNSIVVGSSSLPTPRHHPLRPGSQKEISLINYMDDKILRITRRYGKKYSNASSDADDAPGYTSYEQVVADIDPLVDVVWISGTPSLQIPYLLSLAGNLCSYMSAFPFSPSVFRITSKIDQAFSSLLQASTAGLNGTATLSPVSTTEKVRIKSLIEETRIVAVQTALESGHSAHVDDMTSDEDESEMEYSTDGGMDNGPDTDSISIGLARIYKRTLEILGDNLT